ncbi:MAG: DUF1501 domain-containing protein [Pseudomonadota bacterium]
MSSSLKLSRRNFLQSAGSAILGSGLATTLGNFAANAANTSGYKALVCLFFKGGIDCHDTLFPYDTTSYNRYTELRPSLLSDYEAQPGGSTRLRSELLELSPLNSSDFGSRAFALPPELSGLHSLFENGNAAIVPNVGPLLRPMNRTLYNDDINARPLRLFSHNDQQSTWMGLAPEGQRFGWGGRFADAVQASNANVNNTFTAISVSGNDLFLSGENAFQFQINNGGALTIRDLDQPSLLGAGRNSAILPALLTEHFTGNRNGDIFERDVATITGRAIDSNQLFNEAIGTTSPFTVSFPDTSLGKNLRVIAETLGARNTLAVNRQVFYVATGGFDTHSNQAGDLPRLQRSFDEAISAFYTATVELGIENDVTLFTASDFGRTLIINGDGTDHGWGGHHFVVGGAVNGRRILGDVPPFDVDHDQDVGRGRLIPTTSIEQFAAPLGSWFGLTNDETIAALPRLPSFGAIPNII